MKMENPTKKQNLESEIVDYFANLINQENLILNSFGIILNEAQEEKVNNILGYYQNEWQNADCDDEGANEEQEKLLDSIIKKCSEEITEVIEGK